jgi:hypothetical protein
MAGVIPSGAGIDSLSDSPVMGTASKRLFGNARKRFFFKKKAKNS